MKQIGEPKLVKGSNAWGRESRATHTKFEVEQTDIGTFKDHYLGYRHKSAQFVKSDLGRIITVMTDGTGWTCWSFD